MAVGAPLTLSPEDHRIVARSAQHFVFPAKPTDRVCKLPRRNVNEQYVHGDLLVTEAGEAHGLNTGSTLSQPPSQSTPSWATGAVSDGERRAEIDDVAGQLADSPKWQLRRSAVGEFHKQDADLSSTGDSSEDDLQRVSDGRLLSMLAKMAMDNSEDEAADDEDDVSPSDSIGIRDTKVAPRAICNPYSSSLGELRRLRERSETISHELSAMVANLPTHARDVDASSNESSTNATNLPGRRQDADASSNESTTMAASLHIAEQRVDESSNESSTMAASLHSAEPRVDASFCEPVAAVPASPARPQEFDARQHIVVAGEEAAAESVISPRVSLTELHQLRERNDRISSESATLAAKLHSRQQLVDEKLRAAAAFEEELRNRLMTQREVVQQLRSRLSEDLVRSRSKSDQLRQEAVRLGESQVSLSEELAAELAAQARLVTEMQAECLAERPEARLLTEMQVECFATRPEVPVPISDASTSTLRDVGQRAKVRPAGAASLLSNLEHDAVQTSAKALRIAELRKEVALEKALSEQLQAQMASFLHRVAESTIEAPRHRLTGTGCAASSSSTVAASRFARSLQDGNLTACIAEAESVARQVSDGWMRLGRLGEQARLIRDRLGSDRAESVSLRGHLRSLEVEAAEHEDNLEKARAASVDLRCEVRAEQAAVRHNRHHLARVCQRLEAEVVADKQALRYAKREVRFLREALAVRASGHPCSWCRRRAQQRTEYRKPPGLQAADVRAGPNPARCQEVGSRCQSAPTTSQPAIPASFACSGEPPLGHGLTLTADGGLSVGRQSPSSSVDAGERVDDVEMGRGRACPATSLRAAANLELPHRQHQSAGAGEKATRDDVPVVPVVGSESAPAAALDGRERLPSPKPQEPTQQNPARGQLGSSRLARA